MMNPTRAWFAFRAQRNEIERLKALSVENIMIDVVPGWDGMGEEVYAKSVDDIQKKLNKLGDLEEKVYELSQILSKGSGRYVSAFERGLNDRKAGIPWSQCPFIGDAESYERSEWNRGWNAPDMFK